MELTPWQRIILPSSIARLAAYIDEPEDLVAGNALTLLRDGREAYPAMLAAIESAKNSVHLETYILRDDKTGRRFSDVLCAKAQSGVDVRLIFDAVGSIHLPSRFIQKLRNHGVRVLEYRPVAPWRHRWGWSRRDHRKILVVDGRTGFAGGLNIADDYAAKEEGGSGWRDTHVRIDGPAAYDLERLFRSVWFKETGRWFASDSDLGFKPGEARVQVAANQEFLNRFLIRRSYLYAIGRAQKRILIANAYFIPDRRIRKALYDARARGVDVRVLVPTASDAPPVDYASRRLFSRHMANGLKLYRWPGPVLHAKTMTVDGIWSAVGSYNFTHRSLHHNLEVNLHILDKRFSENLEETLLRDMRNCAPLSAGDWDRRPLSEKILERVSYFFRYLF